LILAFLIVSGTSAIFALRGPNDYGDTINRDYQTEERMTDHEGDDPFDYEWVLQSGGDSDGPLWSDSSLYASQYYEEPFYATAGTSFRCSEDGYSGEYSASATIFGFASQLGITMIMDTLSGTLGTIGSFNEAFSMSVWQGASFVEETDPQNFIYGSTRGEISTFDGQHKAESRCPVDHPDLLVW